MPIPTVKDVLDGTVTFSLPEPEPSATDDFEVLGQIAENNGVGNAAGVRVYSTPIDERKAAQTRANAVKARGLKL